MSKIFKPGKPTVELQPSRIRREPVRAADPASASKAYWDPSEWDSWVVVVGVSLFALAITAISIGFGAITN